MIKIRSIAAILLSILFISAGYSKNMYLKKTYTDSQGRVLPYCELLPENYSPHKTYPLIIFLHAGGERGTDNTSQLKYGSNLFLNKDFRQNNPCVVIFPQCPDFSYWAKVDRINWKFPEKTTEEDVLCSVVELVQSMVKNKKVNQDEIYGIGLSMGGMAILNLVRDYPDMLKSAISVCGATDIKALRTADVKTPVWFIHGDSDPVVPTIFSREAYNVMKDKNDKCRYTEYVRTMHDSWNKAFNEPDFLSWLFED